MATTFDSPGLRPGALRPGPPKPLGITRPQRLSWIAIALGIVGAIVCMMGSWIPSLWGDEAASDMSAQRSIPSLLHMLGHVDAVHGTYYLGLHFWIEIFGSSPFSLRFPSAIAAGLAVTATVLIAGRLSTTRMAWATGIVCIVLPRTTYMGEEARSYAFSAAIAAWLTFLLVELLRRNGRSRSLWIAYGALLAIGSYVFLYLALIAVAHLVILLATRVRFSVILRWILAVTAAAIAVSPLGFVAYLERAQIAYLSHQPPLDPIQLASLLWFDDPLSTVVGWVLVAAGLLAGFLAWRRARRLTNPLVLTPRKDRACLPSLILVAVCWAFIPTGILVSSQLAFAGFTPRYLSFCGPAVATVMALGLSWIVMTVTRRPLSTTRIVIGLAVVVASMTPSYLTQRGPYSKNNSDWAEISATMKAHASPGDAVVFDESARPSRRPRLAMHTYPAGFVGLKDVTIETPYQQNKSWMDRAYTVTQAALHDRFDGVTRLWMIEYAVDGHVDHYGLSPLRDLGFGTVATYTTHSSVIYELTRPAGSTAG